MSDSDWERIAEECRSWQRGLETLPVMSEAEAYRWIAKTIKEGGHFLATGRAWNRINQALNEQDDATETT